MTEHHLADALQLEGERIDGERSRGHDYAIRGVLSQRAQGFEPRPKCHRSGA